MVVKGKFEVMTEALFVVVAGAIREGEEAGEGGGGAAGVAVIEPDPRAAQRSCAAPRGTLGSLGRGVPRSHLSTMGATTAKSI